MSLDIRHMLKVYNYINDEKKPKVNLKFLGLFAALLVAGGALIAFAVTQQGGSQAPVAASQSKTDYVGLAPGESVNVLASDSVVDARLQSWYDSHPDANVERVEPVYEGGRVIGYRITYTDPAR